MHPDYPREAQDLGAELGARADPDVLEVLAVQAQTAARSRDDNHVGTEHVVLGLFRSGPNPATIALERCGITHDVFAAVLDDLLGPSPAGPIPYTPRAMMIGGLATLAADAAGEEFVSVRHLIGVVRESHRWDEHHASGPHHLRSAAETAGILARRR